MIWTLGNGIENDMGMVAGRGDMDIVRKEVEGGDMDIVGGGDDRTQDAVGD